MGARRRTRASNGLKPVPGLDDGAGGALAHEDAGLGAGHDLGRSPDVGGDHRRAAGHGFEQDIGPALAARWQEQGVGGGVEPRQFGMRHRTEETDTRCHTALARAFPECVPLGPVAREQQRMLRQVRKRVDRQMRALALDELAHEQQ